MYGTPHHPNLANPIPKKSGESDQKLDFGLLTLIYITTATNMFFARVRTQSMCELAQPSTVLFTFLECGLISSLRYVVSRGGSPQNNKHGLVVTKEEVFRYAGML